jgi:hypothetical protein
MENQGQQEEANEASQNLYAYATAITRDNGCPIKMTELQSVPVPASGYSNFQT